MERLNPRIRVVWIAAAAIQAAILGAVLVGAAYWVTATNAIGGLPGVLLPGMIALAVTYAVFAVAVAWLRYGAWCFEVQADSLFIERGVFTRVKTVAPFVRIQHVDSRRGPLERATGLATVVVYTAGSRSADVAIPGLTPDRAERLREELRRLAIESEGEDAV